MEIHSSTGIERIIFLIVIFLTFIYSVYCQLRSENKEFLKYAPTLLLSLGVLGTFTGVFISLQAIDLTDSNSVPGILEGFKVAFITSVAGMFFSIIFKTFQSIKPIISINYAARLIENIKELNSNMTSRFNELRANNEKNTILLAKNFDHIEDNLFKTAKESYSEATAIYLGNLNDKVIKPLSSNIVSFNAKLELMQNWQTKNFEQIRSLNAQYDKYILTLSGVDKSLGGLSEKANKINQIITACDNLVNKSNLQIKDLEDKLKAFHEIRNNAVEAFPVIKENIDQIISTLDNAINAKLNLITDSIKTYNEGFVNMNRHYNIIQEELNEHSRNVQEKIINSITQFEKSNVQISTNLIDLTDNMLRSSETLKSDIEKVNYNRLNNETIEYMNSMKDGINLLHQNYKKEITNLFTEITNTFKPHLESFDNQIESRFKIMYEESMKSFNETCGLLATLTLKFDELEGHIEKVNYDKLNNEIISTLNTMKEGVASLDKNYQTEIKKLIADISKTFEPHLDSFNSHIDNRFITLNNESQKAFEKMSELLLTLSRKLFDELAIHIEENIIPTPQNN